MKKIMLIAAAIAALVSCTKEQFKGTSDTFEKGQVVTLKIEAPAQTKATSSADATTGEVSFKWEATDAIKVTVGTSEATFTVSRLINEGESAEFTGKMPAGGETFDVQFPATDPAIATQTYSSTEAIPHNMMKFTAANCSVANPSFTLSAANAVLRLNLWGDKTVGKIVVTNTSSSETPKPSYTLNIQDGKTLGSTSAAATSFFIVVPAEEFQFSAEVFDGSNNHIDKITTKTTFAAGKIVNMPAFRVVEGALPGVFSVSSSKKVRFSKGNLYYTGSAWNFENYQYDYRTYNSLNSCINGSKSDTGTPTNHWGMFGWSSTSNTYGMCTTKNNNDYTGDFVDWGKNAVANGGNTADLWYTMSAGDDGEWKYLLESRANASSKVGYATVAGVTGLIILPDNFTDPMKNGGTNAFVPKSTTGWTANVYTSGGNWEAMESAGAVFLPLSGARIATSLSFITQYGFYWSPTAYQDVGAYYLNFSSSGITSSFANRYYGAFVRLVTAVQ